MEIHGQFNVRVTLSYKSISLLLLKHVRTVTTSLLQAEKSEAAVFLKSSKVSWVFSFLVLLSPAFPLVPFGGVCL